MAVNYAAHFNPNKTPQSQPILGKEMVKNNATFKRSDNNNSLNNNIKGTLYIISGKTKKRGLSSESAESFDDDLRLHMDWLERNDGRFRSVQRDSDSAYPEDG